MLVVAFSKAQTALPVRLTLRAVGVRFLGLWKHELPLQPNFTLGGRVMWNSCLTFISVMVFTQQEMIG